MLENFRDTYLELFYEYIDERLQEQNLILAHLVRYKHLADGKNSGTSSRLRTEMGSLVSLSTFANICTSKVSSSVSSRHLLPAKLT